MKLLRDALRHTLDGKDLTAQYAETIVGCLGSKELKDETCKLLTEAVAREFLVSRNGGFRCLVVVLSLRRMRHIPSLIVRAVTGF